jgi:hypothetical protein
MIKIKVGPMFDEMDRLRDAKELCELLDHYRQLAGPDRQAWQDRLSEMNGVAARDLVKLHGELLAYGWIEQNTGTIPTAQPGAAPGCYRITTAGIRALKQLQSEEVSVG